MQSPELVQVVECTSNSATAKVPSIEINKS